MSKKLSNVWQCCHSDYDTSSLCFYWKIHNFSLFLTQTYMKSSLFEFEDLEATCWLYPRGLKNDPSKNVKFKLELFFRETKNIMVSCTFIILKNDNSKYSRFYSFTYDDKKTVYTMDDYIELEELCQNGYLKGDMLHIKCRIKWSAYKFSRYVENVPNLNLQIKNLEKDLSNDISSLHEDERFSDVCLDVNGVKFRVHRNILAARSSLFAEIFERDTKRKRDFIPIYEMCPKMMKAMITFIYTGEMDDSEVRTLELLQAADMYDLQGLKLLCEKKISKTFTTNNVGEILKVAEIFNAEHLKRLATEFIKDRM